MQLDAEDDPGKERALPAMPPRPTVYVIAVPVLGNDDERSHRYERLDLFEMALQYRRILP